MSNQTVTRAIETDVQPELIYRKLIDVSLIPRWAPVFAEKVEPARGSSFRVTKGGDAFDMELVANEAGLTVDYVREMRGGRRGGAYLRVMPKPMGGSVVVMTVPIGPDATAEQVASVLEGELEALIQLL